MQKNDQGTLDKGAELHNELMNTLKGSYGTPFTFASKFYEDPIIQQRFAAILGDLGQDVDRDGLKNTPRRWLKFMWEFFHPEPFEFTTFEGDDYNEMVIVKDIPFFSMCEHHMAPFFGKAAVGYIPDDNRIVGLSKLPRLVDFHARQLQNQERITKSVVDDLIHELRPKGAACVLYDVRHLCVEMRGIKKHDVKTITSSLAGCFKSDAQCRAEFLNFLK